MGYSGTTILALLSLLASTLLVSDVYSEEGEMLLLEWQRNKDLGQPPDWIWEEARRFRRLANRLNPLDAATLQGLGYLHELRRTQKTATEPEVMLYLERALEYYRASVQLRPGAPWGWFNLALLKLRAKQFDKELALAMERATTLGPWERAVQIYIATEGVAVWNELSSEQHTLLRAAIARGLHAEWPELIALAEANGFNQPRPMSEP